jgi:Flp pilus assembly protein TadD
MRIRSLSTAFMAALLTASPALAAGGGGGADAESSDPDYAKAVELIQAQRYDEAVKPMQSYAARAPKDANAENWLGYAHRKLGRMDAAFMHYGRALAIDAKHRGAHEYVGEAYLMVGNLAKAEEHLKALDKLCWLPCSEHADLKKSIAAYKANGNKLVGSTK